MPSRQGAWWRLAATIGPGLVAMLADTEAGSVITAAQSGARWGYALLLPQFALIPLLFMAQELAARLGLGTGEGLVRLVLRRCGRPVAILLMATLVVSCFGALLTEMSGLAGVGESLGVPAWQIILAAELAVLGILCTGSDRGRERLALAIGACELAFLALAWRAHPRGAQIAAEAVRLPLRDRSYLYLLAANLGTSVMPWMVFYQQSASARDGPNRGTLAVARLETLAGAVLCQCVTAALLIAAAARLRGTQEGQSLATVGQIADAFTASLGTTAGHVVFALGVGGGALVATIVVCLTGGWAFRDVLGLWPSLRGGPRHVSWSHGAFAAAFAAGGALVASGIDLVRLSIAVGVLNAVLLPIVLGALYVLARSALPEELRLRGCYAAAVAAAFVLASVLGLYTGVVGAL